MITQLRNKETGFSLLELSVAVGVAAIVASAGIVATTTFMNDSAEKRDNYTANADNAIANAESSSLALGLTPIVAASNTATSSVGTDSATITWDAPANPVDSFTILVDGVVVEEGISSSATSYTLTGLTAETTYNVVLRSVGSNGTADVQISVVTDRNLTEFELLAATNGWEITNTPYNNALIGYNYISVSVSPGGDGIATYSQPGLYLQADGPSSVPPIIIDGNNRIQGWDGSQFINALSTIMFTTELPVTVGGASDSWDYSYYSSMAFGAFYLTVQPDGSVVETSDYYNSGGSFSWYKTDLEGNIVPWVD